MQEIDQDDAGNVIDSYFKQNGLVSQQISSFNRFLRFNIQDVVREHQRNEIKVEKQYIPGISFFSPLLFSGVEGQEDVTYNIIFGEVIIN